MPINGTKYTLIVTAALNEFNSPAPLAAQLFNENGAVVDINTPFTLNDSISFNVTRGRGCENFKFISGTLFFSHQSGGSSNTNPLTSGNSNIVNWTSSKSGSCNSPFYGFANIDSGETWSYTVIARLKNNQTGGLLAFELDPKMVIVRS